MVNPINANPTTAARRLSIGGSDWLWVVTVIMGFSALFVLTWSKFVGLTPCLTRHASHRGRLPDSNMQDHERSIIWL